MIVAHENVYRRMNPAEFAELVGRSGQAPRPALPAVTFDQGVRFHWNGRHIEVTHVGEAHTDGDAIVHFPRANVFHMGDTFFNGRYPFIDMDSGGGVGRSDRGGQLRAGALERGDADHSRSRRAGDAGASARIPRHAGDGACLRVAGLVANGRTEDQVVAAAPTADLDATWGENPERFVRAVYRSLAGSN